MKKKNIITNNKEIYEKFNMLNFSNEVVLSTVKPIQIEKILLNINNPNKILHLEQVGNYLVIKKIGPVNYNIYRSR